MPRFPANGSIKNKKHELNGTKCNHIEMQKDGEQYEVKCGADS